MNPKLKSLILWRPQRDSNSCYRRERAPDFLIQTSPYERLCAVSALLLATLILSPSLSAAPAVQVQTCADVPHVAFDAPLTACKQVVGGPTFNTDLVLTYIEPAHTQQVWEPWATLATNRSVCLIQPVGPCKWIARGTTGLSPPAPGIPPVVPPVTPPVTPPVNPPPPPIVTHDYTMSWVNPSVFQVSHSADGGKTWDTPVTVTGTSYVYKGLPANISQCFKVIAVGNTDVTTTCWAAQVPSIQ